MFLKFLNFSPVSVMPKNGFIRTVMLISKFMASQSKKQKITKQILLNISRSKGNQALKFNQLI